MSRFYYFAPLDPGCPEANEYESTLFDDPMTQHYGCGDEVWEEFHRKHPQNCKRCKDYGLANIEVRD